MAKLEDHSESFVVRIWRETRDDDQTTPHWRGLIEHVGDSKRQHFVELYRMIGFIRPYIEAMGVRLNWKERFRNWLRA